MLYSEWAVLFCEVIEGKSDDAFYLWLEPLRNYLLFDTVFLVSSIRHPCRACCCVAGRYPLLLLVSSRHWTTVFMLDHPDSATLWLSSNTRPWMTWAPGWWGSRNHLGSALWFLADSRWSPPSLRQTATTGIRSMMRAPTFTSALLWLS